MTTHTYSSGFIVPIDIEPVARIGGARTGRVVHARLIGDFSLGGVTRLAGQLLCGASSELGVEALHKPIDEVSCASCRKLLARWSRADIHTRFAGYALIAGGSTQAVAAMSATMASTLLGVSVGVLARRGIIRIDLSDERSDDHAHIRSGLRAEEYGSVIRLAEGEVTWARVQGPDMAEHIMRQHIAAFAKRGAPRVDLAARQRNRTIRLAEDEACALKAFGGAAWLRQRINRAKRGGIAEGLMPASVVVTIRTTDDQWEKVRVFGGCSWLRSIIHREMQRSEARREG